MLIVLATVAELVASTGRAAAAPAPAEPKPVASPFDFNLDASDPKATAPGAAGGLDFDLMGTDPVAEAVRNKAVEDVERKVKLRRPMLKLHQGLGFATLGVMALTLIIGQLNWNDKYGDGVDDGKYAIAHLGLGVGTTVMFATLGGLGLFAPNPYPKPIKFDTALVHKISMIMATAGMVLQVVLGPIAGFREGQLDQRPIAVAHLVSGYATFACMAVGTVAYFF